MNHTPEALTSTYSTEDLQRLVSENGPFLTVALPTPSSLHDAAHRLSVEWKNARRIAEEGGWPPDRLDELDELLAAWSHGDGAALAVVQSAEGGRLEETLMFGLADIHVSIDVAPRLATVLDNRQRTLPHLVVVADRAGADIVGFDGGAVTVNVEVDGDRTHIHRGHPGGWSQRRFQQRAENTWKDNAESVVDAVLEMASKLQPVVIAVAGDVRAQTMILDGLRERSAIEVVSVDAGDPDGLAAEVVRIVDDQHARYLREAIKTLRDAVGNGTSLVDDELAEGLRDGRVATLFVNDADDSESSSPGTHDSPTRRLVDHAIAQALSTGADVVVIPAVGELSNGAAATARW